MSASKRIHINKLFKLFNINSRSEVNVIAKTLKIPVKRLEFYNDKMIIPYGDDLSKILKYLNMELIELKLRLGVIDREIINFISQNPSSILSQYNTIAINDIEGIYEPTYITNNGTLFQADSIKLMKTMEENTVDMIFADPPFNLSKEYESGINDNLSDEEYLEWTEKWIFECIRILKPGGSLFIYNIPKWLTYISNTLNNYLQFRHWIAINYRGITPPISKKLNVNHYGVLYYIKGESPAVFNTQRIPMKICRHCGGEIHDYGGKKKDVSNNGQTISDVWEDIHPVRHNGHKNREENELPIKLLFRLISLATDENDVVFDPFGGSGTTYIAAELLNRRWIGSEIGSIQPIIDRFKNSKQDKINLDKFIYESNKIFTEEQRKLRMKNKFWLPEDFNQ